MADQATPDNVAEAVQKLVLDEATGEMVSKSELKKRVKKRETDAKKVCDWLVWDYWSFALME